MLLFDILLVGIPWAILEFTGNKSPDNYDWDMMVVVIISLLTTDLRNGMPPKMLLWFAIFDNIVFFVGTLTFPIGIIAYRVMNPKTVAFEDFVSFVIMELTILLMLFCTLSRTKMAYQRVERNQGQENGGN